MIDTLVLLQQVVDIRQWEIGPRRQALRAGDQYPLQGRSLALLVLRRSRRPA